MRRFRFSIPGLPPFVIYIREARKGCEHFCFIGASIDLLCYVVHYEAFIAVAVGKAAFAIGALGVYLLHAEEARERRSAD